MAEPEKNLSGSWEKRRAEAKRKAVDTIRLMQSEKGEINFNSVHCRSGLSKNYLYKEPEVRKLIEEARAAEMQKEKEWHKKYDKTSRSKDVVIEAKEKRIAKLEEENRKLRNEIVLLRGLLYGKQ